MNWEVKRIRFNELHLEFYREYVPNISFQKFVQNAIENEMRRHQKKRLVNPFN